MKVPFDFVRECAASVWGVRCVAHILDSVVPAAYSILRYYGSVPEGVYRTPGCFLLPLSCRSQIVWERVWTIV